MARSTLSSYYAEPHLVRAVRPSDFSYKHKAERTIHLVLTPLSDPVGEGVSDGLRAALDAPPAGQLPITSLFPTFLYLHKTERSKKILEEILLLLRLDVDKEPTLPVVSHPSDPFRGHFETLLYGDQELNRLRMKLCVADFCWVRFLYSWELDLFIEFCI